MSLTLVRAVLLVLVFLAATMLAFGAAVVVANRRAVQRRVALPAGAAPDVATSLRTDRSGSGWVRLLHFVEARGLSLADTKDSDVRRKLAAAGFAHPSAPQLFTAVRLATALILPMVAIALLYAAGRAGSFVTLYAIGSVAGLAGLYLPNLVVSARADRRREALVNGFPDALDLLLVCVEAGLSLDMAFDRVGREMVEAHPSIAELFGDVVTQLRAGRSRTETLERMGARAGVDEIRSFTTLLVQSSVLGVSIGQALRTYAGEMRERRRMRAEEKAHRVPVLISLPLVGCLLPVMIGVLMLPVAIRVVRTLLPALAGR
jgi:tight adherence protein C